MRFWPTVFLATGAMTFLTASQQWATDKNQPIAFTIGQFTVPTILLLVGTILLSRPRKRPASQEVVECEEVVDLEIARRQPPH